MATQSTALAPAKPIKPIDNLRHMLEVSKGQIALALPKHMTPERMMRVAITAVQKQPKLLECSTISIVGAVIEASQLGLEPDGILGQAYLVPFWNNKTKSTEAQLQPGYRGLIALARRSGQVSTLYSELVYEADKFKATKGSHPTLEHEPDWFAEDRGSLVGAYAVVLYKDGTNDWEFMPMHELNRVRDMSKSKSREGQEFGPWATHPEEMYRKVPIRRLAKRLPLSPEFQRAAVLDEYVDAGVAPSLTEAVEASSEAVRMATEQKMEALKERYIKPEPVVVAAEEVIDEELP